MLFGWHCYDVRSLLPVDWQEQVLKIAREDAVTHTLVTKHSTSREARRDFRLKTGSVGGLMVKDRLPWLRTLYLTSFRELAEGFAHTRVSTMRDERFGAVLNVQKGSHDHYECHVDTNPIEGLLYCTSHREEDGGQLIVSNRGDVASVEDVRADCTVIEPRAGYLLFFDARHNSHYVSPLVDPSGIRVVVAMNFYTDADPEDLVRPLDLNRHLTGHD